jgi:hypothetical protein
MQASLPTLDGAARFRAAMRLSMRRCVSGGWAGLALGVLALEGIVASSLAFAPSVRAVALPELLMVATTAFAWGGAILLALFAGRAAFLRDRDEGVLHLVRLRGLGPGAAVLARTAGLALVLFFALSLLVVVTALAAFGAHAVEGSMGGAAPRTEGTLLRTAGACLLYVAAFAAVVAPVVVATLGFRAKVGGTLALVVVFFGPEVLARALGARAAWAQVLSLPGALAAVRHALVGGGDAGGALRGLVGLTAFAFAAILALRAQAALAKELRP